MLLLTEEISLESAECSCHYDLSIDYWNKHQETHDIAAVQEMHRRATRFSDSEGEEGLTDSEKDENEEESEEENEDNSAEENGDTVASNNPFALLGDD